MKNTNNFQKLANIYSELSKIVNDIQSNIDYTNKQIESYNEKIAEMMNDCDASNVNNQYNIDWRKSTIEQLQAENDARNEILNKLELLKF